MRTSLRSKVGCTVFRARLDDLVPHILALRRLKVMVLASVQCLLINQFSLLVKRDDLPGLVEGIDVETHIRNVIYKVAQHVDERVGNLFPVVCAWVSHVDYTIFDAHCYECWMVMVLVLKITLRRLVSSKRSEALHHVVEVIDDWTPVLFGIVEPCVEALGGRYPITAAIFAFASSRFRDCCLRIKACLDLASSKSRSIG